MSWEDCGFKPGVLSGPARCTRTCEACDGEHHFIVTHDEDEEFPPEDGPTMFFQCKHCDVRASMVYEDVTA